MKLINRTLFYYLLISFPLLIVAGLLSYYLIRAEVREGFDEELIMQKTHLEKSILLKRDDQNVYSFGIDSTKVIQPVPFRNDASMFSDTLIYDKGEDKVLGFRVLRSYYNANEKTYLITLMKQTLEQEELAEGLFLAFAVIGLFLMLAFFLINWFVSKRLWRPFYDTVQKLNAYKVKEHASGNFTSSPIIEFDQLNKSLNEMTEKIFNDFRQQKEFTENASHEMQTPLAVIKSNLSLLMQSPNLRMDEMNHLQTIENTIKKLTALNKTLLLLAKIENNQFNENSNVDIAITVKKVLSHFEDLLVAKHIAVEQNLSEKIEVNMNPVLAEILITNLIQNAIRHNVNGGKIAVRSKNNFLEIANTGETLSIHHSDLFTRFKKNDASKESLGLGLSIVKSITEVYKYSISYDYRDSLHIFKLKF